MTLHAAVVALASRIPSVEALAIEIMAALRYRGR